MKCQGDFIYKGLEAREGGEFTNDKGQNIKFEPSYLLKVDEIVDGFAMERTFKFPQKNALLAQKLNGLKLYDHITITFDVILSNYITKIIPIDLVD